MITDELYSVPRRSRTEILYRYYRRMKQNKLFGIGARTARTRINNTGRGKKGRHQTEKRKNWMAGMAVDYVRVVWRRTRALLYKVWFCTVNAVYIDVVLISVKCICILHTFSFKKGIIFVYTINNSLCFLYSNYFVRTFSLFCFIVFVLFVSLYCRS